MGPKRPPPLPKSLFVNEGPLAPGSAPLPPSPTTIHPAFIIDAHSFVSEHTTDPEAIFTGLAQGLPHPPVKSAVQVKLDVSAEPAQAVLGLKPFSIHPTILNLTLATPPSITNIAKSAVDIILPSTSPMTEKEWDLLEEAVVALSGTPILVNKGKYGEGREVPPSPVGKEGKIVISGMLPPPLSKPSTPLLNDEAYSLHCGRLAQLSLHPNVYLKALPPVVDQKIVTENWWTERKELERVLRMYLSPSIETFGTHRLILGTSPALPILDLAHHNLTPTSLALAAPSNQWYAVMRKCLTELGEGAEAVSGVMGENAANVYGLQ